MRRFTPRQRTALAAVLLLSAVTVNASWGAPQNAGNPSVTLDVSPNDGANLSSPASITVTGVGFGSNVSGDIMQCTFDQATQSEICSSPLGRFTSNASGTFTQTVTVTSSFTGFNAQNQPVTVNCLVVACTVQAVSDNGQFFSAHTISFADMTTTLLPTTTSTSTTTTLLPTTTSTSTTTTLLPTTTSTSTTTTLLPTTTSTSTTTTVPPTTTSTSTTTTVPPTTTSTSTTTTTLPVFDICSQLRSYRAIINTHFDLAADILRQALSGEQLSATLAQLELSRALANAQFDAALVRIGCAAAPVGAPTVTASETPPEPVPTEDASETPSEPAPTEGASEPPPGSALPDRPALTSWTVGPGDGLWSVAENTVGNSLGRPASDAEIEDYLALLIEVNRASLADPTNPDMIFPGQVLVVPTPAD